MLLLLSSLLLFPPILIPVIGQSNASGRGNISLLPQGFPQNQSRLYNFSNAWVLEEAHEPIDIGTGQVDGVSKKRLYSS